MTYRSDEELAKQRRDTIASEYQHDSEDALSALGGYYSRRVALRVFAFLSPALLWVLPAFNYWSRSIEFTHQKSSAVLAMSLFSIFGSLLVLWLLYSGAKLLALLQLRRSLRQYARPSGDVYRDLDRLKSRPLDLLKERIARLDYAVPLILLALVLPVVVYASQYLVGFVPFCPERSQAGAGGLALGFLLCALLVHLYLFVALYRLILRARRSALSQVPAPSSYQPGLPVVLGSTLLAIGYHAPRYLPWSGGFLASAHERHDVETLYLMNAFLFLFFIALFEIAVYNATKAQATLLQEAPEEFPN